jgi:hypothetical protein
MEANDETIRSYMGCGWLPSNPKARPWSFPHPAKDAPEATLCPGYTTSLPVVREVASARLHWSKGALQGWCGGDPHEGLLIGIEVLEQSANAVASWAMTPKDKGGGA